MVALSILLGLVSLIYGSCVFTGKNSSSVPAEQTNKKYAYIPEKPENALGGREFISLLGDLVDQEREEKIFQEIANGNIPEFLRKFKTIEVTSTDQYGVVHRGEYRVMPDVLAIGSNDNFVRIPITPITARKIADIFGCILPTRKIVDDVHENASSRIPMVTAPSIAKRLGIPWDPDRPDSEYMISNLFYEIHNELTEERRKEYGHKLGELISGIKKELIITKKLLTAEQGREKLAFHGGLKPGGGFWQSGADIAHTATYVDYSHGVRLVARMTKVDGKEMDIVDVLKDSVLCKLVSDEGPLDALVFYRSEKDIENDK